MDNGLYRVTVGTRGQITSLLDHKDGDRELVQAGASLNDLGSNTGSGQVVLESLGPVSATIKVAAAAPMRRDMRITLFAGVDRIDMRNEALENFSNDQDYESKFNLTGATMRHEEVGKVAVVARLASGGDYANENTRTDFLTLNHFVDLSEASRGATLSSWDSPFFRPGNSTATTLDGATPRIRAIIGNQINGTGNGIADQGGDAYFLDRFALRTHGAWDAAAAMRFALEDQNPLVAIRVLGGGSSPLPDTAWSLVSLGSSDVLLWALKPAEEGIDRGLIARAWNLASAPSAVTLQLPALGIASATRTTHIETDEAGATVENGALLASLAPQQIGTWRLTPGSTAASGAPGARPRALFARPNPARARDGVALAFALSRPGAARLDLLDVRGARVARLLDGPCAAGPHEVRWSGRGDDGRRVPPGLYFMRLETPDGVTSGRFVLLE
jgi:alpha-mannosidase